MHKIANQILKEWLIGSSRKVKMEAKEERNKKKRVNFVLKILHFLETRDSRLDLPLTTLLLLPNTHRGSCLCLCESSTLEKPSKGTGNNLFQNKSEPSVSTYTTQSIFSLLLIDLPAEKAAANLPKNRANLDTNI